MSRLLSHLKFRKRILFLLLLAAALAGAVLHFSGFPVTERQKFDRFTEDVFRSELAGSTLNLHYTVAAPAEFGLEDCEVSLGDASLSGRMLACASCENYLSALDRFSYGKLSRSQQLTFDIFRHHLETELSSASLLLYDEPLGPMLGIQAQLPILLAEYNFRTKKDIEDYLTLLTRTQDYFDSILSFEKDKAASGLFMSDANANAVIAQCRDFIRNPDQNYLTAIFEEKIDAISNLTADEKIAYKERNRNCMAAYVLPAYESLISTLQSLLGSGKNDKGLYYLPQGTAYYEYLIRSTVGDDRSIPEIEEAIKQQMVADFEDARALLTEESQHTAGSPKNTAAVSSSLTQPDTLPSEADAAGTPPAEASAADTLPSEADAADALSTGEAKADALSSTSTDAVAMLKELRSKIPADFPAAPAVSCEVKYVHKSLQDYLSPAFYLTPAIDNYTENVIYINPANSYSGVELYTTLAHEGYPGHLYQSVYFTSQSPDLLRCILDTGGYTEGWATYVEMYAYSLWEENPRQAALAQKNRSFTLGLASLLDIGIHYRGYSLDDVSAFLDKLGFDSSAANSLYQSILQAPGNYLKYYVGCQNFLALRDEVKTQLGNRFSLKAFHEAVLKTGPAPFPVLKKYVFEELQLPCEEETENTGEGRKNEI